MDTAAFAFEKQAETGSEPEQDVNQLFEQIGKLTLETDFLLESAVSSAS